MKWQENGIFFEGTVEEFKALHAPAVVPEVKLLPAPAEAPCRKLIEEKAIYAGGNIFALLKKEEAPEHE